MLFIHNIRKTNFANTEVAILINYIRDRRVTPTPFLSLLDLELNSCYYEVKIRVVSRYINNKLDEETLKLFGVQY